MEKLKTATGKTFDCDYFNPSATTRMVNINILNASVTDVAAVFANPAETVQLWYADQYLANYTKLIAIFPEGNAIRVVLGKE